MAISVTCPSCNRNLKAPQQAAGKRVKCPQCGKPITVPDNIEKAKPTLKRAKPPKWMAPADVEDVAAGLFLEGEQLSSAAAPTSYPTFDKPLDEALQVSARRSNPEVQRNPHVMASLPEGKKANRLWLWGVCGAVVLVMIVGAYLIDRMRTAAEADRQAQLAAADRAVQKSKEEREAQAKALAQQQAMADELKDRKIQVMARYFAKQQDAAQRGTAEIARQMRAEQSRQAVAQATLEGKLIASPTYLPPYVSQEETLYRSYLSLFRERFKDSSMEELDEKMNMLKRGE